MTETNPFTILLLIQLTVSLPNRKGNFIFELFLGVFEIVGHAMLCTINFICLIFLLVKLKRKALPANCLTNRDKEVLKNQ